MVILVGAVEGGRRLAAPVAIVGMLLLLLLVVTPVHEAISANLDDRAAWL